PSPRPEPLPEPLDRPFWLLDPPLPLKLAGHRPQYAGQALRLMRGPERIESGWWDPALTVRDYFVAEDAAGARYWIYRERDDEHARWHLHGLYA
ncbi:nucleotidyltransferase/DNA polymerase, partial [Achromobacter xylosoxidans]